MSNSLQPREPKHTRPSPTPRVHPNSCPLCQWCHSAISYSVVPFSSCLQSLPASGSFPMSQLFASGGQSIEVSASISVRSVNTQDWSRLGWTGWISSPRDTQESSPTPQIKSISFYIVQLSHPYMTTGKTIALTRLTFADKVMCLLFNMVSRLVITVLPKNKCLLSFMAGVTICGDFGAPQNKVSHCFPIYLPWNDGTGCHDLSFLNVEL